MDHNAERLREVAHLRQIGMAWKGGDELPRSLEASRDAIVDTIIRSNDALYNIASYREIK